ncbi:tripartite tricarboxylate transporter substrate binding protein BugD [Cupriavidus cauae]|uniref:Tripartite tricarboxylate transporter substrate binding protein BugD n=1 Tax=Cupriavidus cauae TaxID=2608999 RepID=A0A5M8AJW1_9BURK|nr:MULTISPECIES: tripartite tricarboxylate transporter substrate-binding protein [Cupriavidus]KAA0180732.1 tripartite tricarboxylate transporter substrate binding protein BugD [Cupriavidus gilardii]KAA6123032.1 tripartite tricarboxylate transporter substrate binding protein BugD [Cupriavidus cauae]MCA7082273.1 tripartite tricarboxylate transporter substrate binding protein BugD [Cupriavidus sp. DB3]UZN51758.1 tripartite tricarboxylate transporter substrate binding protein BugD [Cupriavidus caua
MAVPTASTRSLRPLASLRRLTVAALGLFAAAGVQAADPFPHKPIALVVPFSAGGPTDVVARSLGQAMSRHLGQSVVVENRTGAGGTIAPAYVARAEADGYTLLIHHNGMATAPALYRKLSYDPLKDFEYIGQVADVPMTLLGKKDLPPNNTAELVRYVQQNESKINLANAGLGAVSQLCGLLFEQATNVKLNVIPFQGTAPAMTALLGGQVDVLCDQTTATLPQIAANKVKLYGVTTPQRIRALPNAPTLQEGGLKGFEMKVWHGVYAPKGTPAPVVARLTAALQAALKDPAVVKRLDELGAEIVPPAKQTPEGLKTWLKAESDKWQPMLRKAGAFAD